MPHFAPLCNSDVGKFKPVDNSVHNLPAVRRRLNASGSRDGGWVVWPSLRRFAAVSVRSIAMTTHAANNLSPAASPPEPHNLRRLDYVAEARRLGPPVVPIVDAHSHIHGTEGSKIYERAARLYGVRLTYTMTQIVQAPLVRDVLGDTVRFIAMPSFWEVDREQAFRKGYCDTIERFATQFGARMMKIWRSPALRDIVPSLNNSTAGATDLAEIDSYWCVEHAKVAQQHGMMIMVHVADPDTWFARKYNNPVKYGTKAFQYLGLERMLDRFPCPWIAAHMGGWPEDLVFLDSLLTRHPNLHLDTSAMKWICRELSAHPAGEVAGFLKKWEGRIIFGSDIVTSDDHTRPQKETKSPKADQASSPEGAFELYCSRYWALRTMLETGYEGPSNIADTDLVMMDPDRHTPMDPAPLRGLKLDAGLLKTLYSGVHERVVDRWWREHP